MPPIKYSVSRGPLCGAELPRPIGTTEHRYPFPFGGGGKEPLHLYTLLNRNEEVLFFYAFHY
jgi:hypothetical protein